MRFYIKYGIFIFFFLVPVTFAQNDEEYTPNEEEIQEQYPARKKPKQLRQFNNGNQQNEMNELPQNQLDDSDTNIEEVDQGEPAQHTPPPVRPKPRTLKRPIKKQSYEEEEDSDEEEEEIGKKRSFGRGAISRNFGLGIYTDHRLFSKIRFSDGLALELQLNPPHFENRAAFALLANFSAGFALDANISKTDDIYFNIKFTTLINHSQNFETATTENILGMDICITPSFQYYVDKKILLFGDITFLDFKFITFKNLRTYDIYLFTPKAGLAFFF